MSIPELEDVPFVDGPRKIQKYLAVLFKARGIPTHQLTFEQSVARMNKANEHNFVSTYFDDIKAEHLRKYGS